MKSLFLIVLAFFLIWENSYSQKEICNNGKDDDNNGFIDLNDTACICKGIKDTLFIPSSLIPNPSFEEHVCCPNGLAQLSCSKNWIQASVATSDYYHLCGYKNDVFRGSPPQPLPADSGYVGFLDLKNHPANNNATYKEYIGACLNKPMLPGKEYTLTFWLGFGTAGSFWGPRNSTTISIFGTSDCKNLPFGIAVNGQLCPTNYSGWFQMTSVTASGRNKWVKLTVKLRPTVTTEAIVLGPSCTRADGNYYYWMDDLILEESAKFDSLHIDIVGNNCSDSILLKSAETLVKRIKYQWYKDGIAITNADTTIHTIYKGETGRYLLRAADGKDCELSNSFDYQLTEQKTSVEASICQGAYYEFGNQQLTNAGNYELLLKTYNGCDSLVSLTLHVLPLSQTRIDTILCKGMWVEIDNNIYDSTGTYDIHLLGWQNCDSIIQLNLQLIDNKSSTLDTQICEGNKVLFDGKSIDASGIYVAHNFTREGCDSLIVLKLAVNPVYNTAISVNICEGHKYIFNNKEYEKEGKYLIHYTTANSCDSNIELNLKINPNQHTILNRTLCDGEFLDVGGSKFSKSGSYQIIFQSTNQCDSIINLNLQVNPISHRKIDTSICKNQQITINKIKYSTAGDFMQMWKNYLNCDSIITIHIESSIPPAITAAIKQNACYGEANGQIKVDVLGLFGAYTYTWNTGQNSAIIQNLKAGNYTLTVTDRLLCQETIQVNLIDPPLLEANIQIQDANCNTPELGKLHVNVKGGNPPYYILINGKSWNGIDNEFAPGNYEINILDSNACSIKLFGQIQEAKIGKISFNNDTIYTILGDSVLLHVDLDLPTNLSKIKWTGAQKFSCDTCTSTQVFADKELQKINVQATDANGCFYETQIIIRTKQNYYVPNVFSPNGDQLNDYFTLLTDESISTIDLFQIYDRWGELVHESTDFRPNAEDGAWKGEFRGQKINPGVYVYVFVFHDKIGKLFKLAGDVTLIR